MKLTAYLLALFYFHAQIIDAATQNTGKGRNRTQSVRIAPRHAKQPPPRSLEEGQRQYEKAGQLLLSGYQHIDENRLDQALEVCRESARIYAGLTQPAAVMAHICIADVFFRKKDYQGAKREAEKSLEVIAGLVKIESRINDMRFGAQINHLKSYEKYRGLLIAGQSLNYVGENEAALSRLQEARDIANGLNKPDLLADALTGLGKVQVSLQKYDEALENYEAALSIYKQCPGAGCPQKRAYVADQIGIAHAEQGNFKTALVKFQEALEMMKALNDTEGIPYAQANIGCVYAAMRNLTEAREYYKKALSGFKQDTLQQSITWNNLAIVAYYEAKLGEAEINARKAAKLAERIGANEHIAIAQNTLGNIYLARVRADKVRNKMLFNAARTAYLSSLKNGGGVIVDVNLSRLEYDEGNYSGAVKRARRASERARQYIKPDLFTRAKQIEGKALRKLGRLQEAADALREAVRSAENERGMAAGDWKNLYLFFETKSDPHRDLIDILVELYQRSGSKDGLGEALRYAEQSKARVILDMLRNKVK